MTHKKFIRKLRKHLSQPLTRDLDLDDPQTTELRKKILIENRFLHNIYWDWYSKIIQNLPSNKNPTLEIGSGAGFLNERIPQLIQSDILYYPGLSLVVNGGELPFVSESLGTIILINTFHHIPDIMCFLTEVSRTLKKTGRMIMVEPWVSPWSVWVYKTFHHEPFDPKMKKWTFPQKGPLSGANGALPWIVFQRDREKFIGTFKRLSLLNVSPMMPLLYLFSGGVSMRPLIPDSLFNLMKRIDLFFKSIFKGSAMFALIVIEKK